MKVVVDIMGGDYSPEEIVKGCVEALSERSDFSLVMTGDKNKIEELLLNYTVKPDRIEIVDAQEIITNDEVPTVAVKTKKNSSLVVACERVKEDDECIGMVSAGSTGAVLTAATLKIGRIKGITRPALAPVPANFGFMIAHPCATAAPMWTANRICFCSLHRWGARIRRLF